jgi:hypothetical protein
MTCLIVKGRRAPIPVLTNGFPYVIVLVHAVDATEGPDDAPRFDLA